MITYHATKAGALPIVRVLLDGRWVGIIKEAPGGFRYVPKRGEGGVVYPTIQAVKASLEAEEEGDTACDTTTAPRAVDDPIAHPPTYSLRLSSLALEKGLNPMEERSESKCIHNVPAGKPCARCRADLQPVGRTGRVVDLDTHRNGFIYDPE